MPMTRISVTGPEAQAFAISNLLTSLSGIEPVDEVGDLMSRVDDKDASSAVRSISAAGA